MELDRIDRHILNLLQRDNRITNAHLAEQVGLSPPACLQRVRRLRSSKLIRADVLLLEPALVGQMLTMIVEVELERDRPDLYERFASSVHQANEVTQCYRVTGEVDVVLVVSVADLQAFEAFVQRVLYAEPNMRKFRTLISLKREKFETAIEL
ncbi:Lrp/AsnC family transcriptional regulator [Motiliproteus sp. MSK22-1]|uniref:Lrp/AsnC family transcriptional regulator n=1 Tax=Motiliproteus sp. MSK22-1 TaxID=1897630 RepID=UPI0009789339|nr:Lrp/AsnC family transcriptional regulator [Motiliproteus sp. MSK22-1]OMH30255.1 ArsR family transcriptional regulator [Motiliproteus sp. MSK22-1]